MILEEIERLRAQVVQLLDDAADTERIRERERIAHQQELKEQSEKILAEMKRRSESGGDPIIGWYWVLPDRTWRVEPRPDKPKLPLTLDHEDSHAGWQPIYQGARWGTFERGSDGPDVSDGPESDGFAPGFEQRAGLGESSQWHLRMERDELLATVQRLSVELAATQTDQRRTAQMLMIAEQRWKIWQQRTANPDAPTPSMQPLIASAIRAVDGDTVLGKEQLVYHSVHVEIALRRARKQLLRYSDVDPVAAEILVLLREDS